MNVAQLMQILEFQSGSALQFILPSGERIPDHFHVTEVGRVEKDFIDCGGTRRQETTCLLQTWTSIDVDHRLQAGKLAKILRLAAPILKSTELPVQVEYGPDVAAQYHLADVAIADNELLLMLVGKQTDCLAKDQCGVGECETSGCCT